MKWYEHSKTEHLLTEQVGAIQQNLQVLVADHLPLRYFHFTDGTSKTMLLSGKNKYNFHKWRSISYHSERLVFSNSISSFRSMPLLDWFNSDFPPLNLSGEEISKVKSIPEGHRKHCGQANRLFFLTNVKQLTLVDDHLLQLSLVWGLLQYFLVDGVCCDQAIHHNWFGLTDAVTAVLSLQVCLRVLRQQ